jgi:diguanylate cyclase (GGDEF)-like protein/PAS domain S-box-containing protein
MFRLGLVTYLAQTLTVAAVCGLSAQLGLELAIPSGHGTVVWPPSGIALALMLWQGYRVLPGVLLGSFLANALSGAAGPAIPLAAAGAIALGSAFQALFATALYRRFIGSQTPERIQDAGKFLGIAALSCVLAATAGTIGLALPSATSWQEYLTTWLSWWFGDLAWTLIVTPPVLYFVGSSVRVTGPARLNLPLVGLSAGFTLIAFHTLWHSERQTAAARFQGLGKDVEMALRRGVDASLHQIEILAAVRAVAKPRDRAGFRALVDPLLKQDTGLAALAWGLRVPAALRETSERAAGRAGYDGFQITERLGDGRPVRAGVRAEYYPVYFIEPLERHAPALGYDLASDPRHLEALLSAFETGRPAVTAPIRPVPEIGDEAGVLVIWPVPASAEHSDDIATGVIRIDALAEAALAGLEGSDLDLYLFDASSEAGPKLLYGRLDTTTGEGLPDRAAPGPAALATGLHYTARFAVAGREWLLIGKPGLGYRGSGRGLLAWGILAGGLLFTALVGACVYRYQRREAWFRNLADGLPALIWVADAEGRCTWFNTAWREFTGGSLDQEPGCGWADRMHPDDREGCLEAYRVALERREPFAIEYRARRHDGVYRWLLDRGGPYLGADGVLAGFIGGCIDLTERRESEERVEALAHRDPLTGLPNRALLLDRLAQALAQAERGGHPLALLFTDLDRFKPVNDTLGHPVGDALLGQIAERLRAVLRDGDTVARLGGDEFVILLPRILAVRDASRVAIRALESLSAPFLVMGHELQVTASIGVSLYPKDATDAESLIKHADTALYQAKRHGRNQYRFFSPSMNAQGHHRLAVEGGLKRALERRELVVHYQPQFDLETHAVTAIEAHVRWQHPEYGLLLPADFIPVAEESGLIVAIGEWVLESACRQAIAWQVSGLPGARIAVKLSSRQFQRRRDVPGLVDAVLGDTGLAPARLEIEITEAAVIADPEHASELLGALHERGVRLTVDDFGTGYSSLSYLKRLPLDRIKIDQSLVRGLPEDSDSVAIVKAILAMARQIRLGVIAEGVEVPAQYRFLREHRCDEAQGYLFTKPLPADALAEFLAKTAHAPIAGE